MAARLPDASFLRRALTRQLTNSGHFDRRTNSGLGPCIRHWEENSRRLLSCSAQCRTPSRIIQDLEPETRGASTAGGAKFLRQLEKALLLKSPKETAGQLAEGLVHADPGGGGLVVVNKPYGLPVNRTEDSPVSLASCLPLLAAHLGTGELRHLH
jgi:hypothetical protein